jgi:hypothetical protein
VKESITKEISLSGTSTTINNSSISGMATGRFLKVSKEEIA